MRFFLSAVLLLALSACSKPTPQSQASYQLIVDDKPVFDEKASNKDLPALEKKHLALGLQVEASCWLARFMHENIQASGTQAATVVSKTGQVAFAPLASDPNLSRTMNAAMADHLCPIERQYRNSCSHEQRKNSTAPPDDHLQLLNTLQTQYGMQRSAQWKVARATASADKSEQLESTQVLRMDPQGFSCSTASSTVTSN